MTHKDYYHLFHKEVLSEILPNLKNFSTFSMFADGTEPKSASFMLPSNADFLYRSTIYDKKLNKLTFLHFTSLDALINIIKSTSLHMYSLQTMKDQLEFSYGNESIKNVHEQITYEEWIKKSLFSLSFVDSNIINKTQEYFLLWKL